MPDCRIVQVQSLKNQSVIADQCIVAVRFFDRLKGLIGKRKLEAGRGVLFPKCNNIHMWFMSIPIDVVFIRRTGLVWKVTSVRENARPWRFLPLMDWRASETLEFPAGTIRSHAIEKGDELCIS